MSKKEEIISDASLYSVMSILTQIVTLVAGILTRRFLGPVQTGVWALLQIILVYASYSMLGVAQAAYREIPFHRGKGEMGKADKIKDLVYSFSTVMSTLVSVSCIIYAFLMRDRLRSELFYGLLVVSILVMLQRSSNLNITFLRGYKLFSLAAKQMLLSAIVNAFLVIGLSYKFKIYGFMLAMCLSFIFTILYINAHHSFHFRWSFDFKKIWGLIRFGFPLVVVSLLSTFFITIDKIMITKIIGIEQLGLYSVAMLAYTYLNNVPNSIGIVLIPNFHQKFGETENALALKNYIEKSSYAFEIIMPILIGAAWFLVPYFARLVLPDFLGSIPPMKYLIVGVFWVALIDLYSYFLVVIRKQVLLVPIIGGCCVLAFLFNLFALTYGFGILGVGIVTTVVFFCNFTATYFLSCKHLYKDGSTWPRFLKLILKFSLMVLAMMALDFFFQNSEISLSRTLAKFVIFFMLYLLPLCKLNDDLQILATLKMKLFSKKKTEIIDAF